MTPSIACVLPHFKPYGGVRRHLELGNVFVERGHSYSVYCYRGSTACDWFHFKGKIKTAIPITEDVLLVSSPTDFKHLQNVSAHTKIFVWVIGGGIYIAQYRRLYGKYNFIVNHEEFLEYFPKAHLCVGGVNTSHFTFKPVRVGYQKRVEHNKGSAFVEKSLSPLSHVELVPVAGYSNDDLPIVYKSLNYFVHWETHTGWPNCAAEALACGTPVVTNGYNTQALSDLVIKVKDLRAFFENPVGKFSWGNVADRLLEIFLEAGVR